MNVVLEYPWYALVEGEELEQGDFIDESEVIIPQFERTKVLAQARTKLPDQGLFSG